MGILTYSPLAGGWLSGSQSADSSPTSPARQRLAARFDMSLPENQRKLEAVEQLAKVAEEAGVSLIELAIAFVGQGVASSVLRPRVPAATTRPHAREPTSSNCCCAAAAQWSTATCTGSRRTRTSSTGRRRSVCRRPR
jgi:hypothetical protein